MSSTNQHIINNPLSAFVFGNFHYLGVHLSLLLNEYQVTPILVSEQINHYHPLYKTISTNPNIHIFQELENNPTQPSYIFHIFSPLEKSSDIQQSLQLANKHQAKFCFISPHPISKPDSALLDLSPQIISDQQIIKTAKNLDPQLNVRVVHVNHLMGAGVNSKDPAQLQHILDSFPKSYPRQPGEELPAFPLSQTDAASGILKATFTSNSKDKIFELAGSQTSLLNLLLKIREHSLTFDIKQESSDPINYLSPPIQLIEQIQATQDMLRWRPQIDTSAILEESFHYLLINPNPNTTTSTPEIIIPTPPPHLSSDPSHTQDFKPKTPKPSFKKNKPKKHLQQNPSLLKPPDSSMVPPKIFSNLNKEAKANKSKLFILAFLFIVITIIAPISTAIFALYQTSQDLNATYTSLLSGDIDSAQQKAVKAGRNITFINTQYSRIYPITKLIIGESSADNISQLLNTAQTTTLTITESSLTLSSSNELFDFVFSQSGGDLLQIVNQLSTNLTTVYFNLSKLQAQLNSSQQLMTMEPFSVGTNLKKISDHLPEFRHQLSRSRQLLNTLPDLLGHTKKQTYLVLLQNNAELRPTGGFIGSYALITFEAGKLLDIKVEDVYTADGQLRGHVEPPEPIKKYLGEAGWFLRDSNWDPNFPTSATRASWFLDKQLGIHVDGVVAINLNTIKELLKIVGPIQVPDFDETITADNLFERAQYQVEINQFPGSTQKRDFIGKLSNSLMNQILSAPTPTWFQIVYSLVKAADQSQLYVFVNHQPSQHLFSSFGWSGAIVQPTCQISSQNQSCTTDYLYLVDSNMGVNKANYFVNKTINLTTSINTQGSVQHALNINYKNSSIGETWPGGTYKNYLRVYTPPNSTLNSVSVNNQPLDESLVDVTLEHEKTVFGFLVSVKPQETNNVIVNYTSGEKLRSQPRTLYTLYLQKQSGTNPEPFSFNLTPPSSLSPVPNNQFNLSTSSLRSNLNFNQNHQFMIEFAPQL